MSETTEQLLQQLEEKIKKALNDESAQVYEALQYVQSFIARKKKFLGQAGASSAVFLGAKLLIERVQFCRSTATAKELSQQDQSLSLSTGVLLKWFIEEGAGKDSAFLLHVDTPDIKAGEYCDAQRLLHLLSPLDKLVAGAIVDSIYNPLHLLLAKTKIKKNSALAKRVLELEILFAGILLECKKWLFAFKSYARLQDAVQLIKVLSSWAADGYKTEKPLFFARGLLYLLSEGKLGLSRDLLQQINSQQIVEDNIALVTPTGLGGLNGSGGGPFSASLAVFHVSTILTDLANLPPLQRVDKQKLFGLILQRYAQLFSQLDSKLLELLVKVGEVVFEYRTEAQENTASVNPMALLQNLFSGGLAGANNSPAASNGKNTATSNSNRVSSANSNALAAGLGGLDLNAMINMMNKLQQQS